MRFRKRLKVFPGFYLNFSKSGVSSTIGIKGASINFSKKGTYLNTGIPGTGFYDRQKIGDNNKLSKPSIDNPSTQNTEQINHEEKHSNQTELTSTSLLELKSTLSEVYKDRIELSKEYYDNKNKLKSAKRNRILACIFIFGLFIKSFKNKITELEEYLVDITNQYNNCFVNIDINFDEAYNEKYQKLVKSYTSLLSTEKIWDITSSSYQDRIVDRSAASTVVTRSQVKFRFDNIDIIKSKFPALHFENKNSDDLYVYPAFIIITTNKKDFSLIDIKDLKIYFSTSEFVEAEQVPNDSKIIGKTWAKVNKNGTPDRRFNGNYEIPIVQYGELTIQSTFGLNEVYSFSNYEQSKEFATTFFDYQNSL